MSARLMKKAWKQEIVSYYLVKDTNDTFPSLYIVKTGGEAEVCKCFSESLGETVKMKIREAVLEDAQKVAGLARDMLEACQKWAKEQGCTGFAGDCELDNEDSLKFHIKMGFVEVNRIICFTKRLTYGDRLKNKLDSLFFAQLFVSERKQIALMADENLRFSSPLRDKSLRNED